MEEKKTIVLPADDAVQNWFEENIDKECSASSAVYKFRQWLESLQVTRQVGAVWVKASERLPGFKTPVKWRLDGIERNKGKVTVVYMANGESPAYLSDYEWLDATPAAGREEDAVKFHDWAINNAWEIDHREEHTHTTAELYAIFKQQS